MIARALALGLCVFTLVGCSGFGPDATGEQIESLTRGAHAYTGSDGTQHRVGWLVAGDPAAPRVILVHGSPSGAWTWADELIDPVPGAEVIAVDRPGFGGSDEGASVVSFEDQARAIRPLLIERGGRWPILVGHSLGAPIVATLAAMHPEQVGGLVLVAGNFDPALEFPRPYNRAGSVLRPVIGRMLRHSNDEMMAARDEVVWLEPRLAQIRCPVTIIHGTDDWLVPVENVAHLRRLLNGASEVTVDVREHEGHLIPWNDASSIRGAIGRMLRTP